MAETPSHPDFRATLAGCTALSREMRGKMNSRNEKQTKSLLSKTTIIYEN
jgi:hypothetical protein